MKIKTLLLPTIIFLYTFTGNTVNADLTLSQGLTPLTSGIKSTYQMLEWCQPFSSTSCKGATLYNVGGQGVASFDGAPPAGYPGTISLNPPNSTTRSLTQTSTSGMANLFDTNSLKFQGEGTYKVTVALTDYANNASVISFMYKIDKTAPQFKLDKLTETTGYTFAGNQIDGIDNNAVFKYDSHSSVGTSNDNSAGYNNPIISDLGSSDSPSQRNHTRTKLHSFYFKDLATAIFNIISPYDDTYNNYLKSNLVSGFYKFALIGNDGTTIVQDNLNNLNNISNMFQNQGNNTQKKYKVRVYDRSEGPTGPNGSNYSEITFYVVKDNVPPNMMADGSVDIKTAIEKTLMFEDNPLLTAWDKTISGYNPSISGFSKFIAAYNQQPIFSYLTDIGIIGIDNVYEKYNAGVGNGIISIEKADNINAFDEVARFNPTNSKEIVDRFPTTSLENTKDFSNVYNNSTNGYRKYSTTYKTNGNINGLCDLVGNCLYPKIEFRVVANTLNNYNSKLSLTTSGPKIIANGSDKYTIESQLRDIYNNPIVGVFSPENNQTIKTVDSKFYFKNLLWADQVNLSNNPSNKKVVIATDAETDNINSSTTLNTINDPSNESIYFKEDSGKNGNYKFTIASKVPTTGLYPHLGNAILTLKSINPKATGVIGENTYPKSGNSIGIFDNSINGINLGDQYQTNFQNGNLAGLDKGNGVSDLLNFDKNSYGNISIINSPDSFTNLGNRKLELDFGASILYGMINFNLDPLFSFNSYTKHKKQILKIDPLPTLSYIYEKYIASYGSQTSGVVNFDYKDPSGSNNGSINNGVTFGNGVFTNFDNGTNILNSIISATLNTTTGRDFEIKASPALTSYDINTPLKFGFLSYIGYIINGDDIVIPSITRNLAKNTNPLDPPIIDTGLINPDIGIGPNLGIAVNGLSNKNNLMINDPDGTKGSVDILGAITKTDMMKVFKQNIKKYSDGITWCEAGINGITISDSSINNLSGDNTTSCTKEINGEIISFIKGNIIIDCGITCSVNNNLKRSIIVKDGYTYIKSNISTKQHPGSPSGQLLIGTIANAGLENININPTLSFNINDTITINKIKGWNFIDPSVTNLDAFIVAQGPFVSYDDTKSKLYGNTIESNELRNQLFIYGSLFSLNTLGGFKAEGSSFKCPYIIGNCTSNISGIFDLVFLRRYILIGKKFYDPSYTEIHPSNPTLVPYHPDSTLADLTSGSTPTNPFAKRSCGAYGPFEVYSSNNNSSCNSNLRYVANNYIKYALVINRDKIWDNKPSILFEE